MRVSENRRYLEQDGRPFFYLADTAWKLLTAPDEAEARHYLRTRQEQGFSVIMPVLATERARGEEAERSAFLDDDPDRPDEAFFARVDRLVAEANALGLWMALLPAWGSYVGGGGRDRPVLDVENARRYGAYVGRRYRDRNVIWVVGGDRRVTSEREAAIWRALAGGLEEGDGAEHVMTFHPPGLQGGGHSSLWFHEDDWLDFNLLQTGVRYLEDDLCAHYLADYQRLPTKPYLDGETRYENSHRNFSLPRPMGPKITAFHVRQAAYYAMLCGAAGHTYGCRDVWSFYVPSERPPTRCVDLHWRQALHLPGARQLQHWRALFERYPWHRLVPDVPGPGAREPVTEGSQAVAERGAQRGAQRGGRWEQAFGQDAGRGRLITHGAWDGTANLSTPAAIADDGSFALIYLPQPMPVWVDLAQIGGPGAAVDALWFDPRTGEERYEGRYSRSAGTGEAREARFFPPGDEQAPDWVLVLRAAGSAGGGGDAQAGGQAAVSVVLYAEPLPPDLQPFVRAEVPPGWTLEVMQSHSPDELRRRLAGAEFVIVATARIDAETLAAAPRLRHVQHQGVGYDNIDVPACRARGVSVALTPEGTTTGVAEHTLLLLLALYKRLREAESRLRAGGWPVWELRSGSYEIAGKTLGLVGFGRIGQAVARRAAAFEARVLYYDPFRPPPEVEQGLGVAYRPLDDLLGEADVVSLHLPLSGETRHLIGARELALMRPGAVLLNTARGALVDEGALVQALARRSLAGAGLDVFEREPPQAGNPLLEMENVVLTPHIAAGSADAFRVKMRAVFANLARVAGGDSPLNQVTS